MIIKSDLPKEIGPVYTPEEVATMFGVKVSTVGKWIRTGKLDGFKTPGNRWRIRQAALDALAQELHGENS